MMPSRHRRFSQHGYGRCMIITRSLGRSFRWLLSFVALFAWMAQPAFAQQILRDTETEALLHDAAAPLVKAAGLDPKNVQILLINDPSINAFVAGGQIVWIHSGLIAAAANVNEVQGVIAHELGHIEGGHIVRAGEGMKAATGITLLSMVLGAAAMAAGGGEAGMGVIAAGQQAALGKYLAFSRTQEASADQAAVRYLHTADVSGKGMLDFFKTLQNQEYRYRLRDGADDGFAATHPLTGDRIALLGQVLESDGAWKKPVDPGLEARFQRVKAKLGGYVSDPPVTLAKYPRSDTSIPATYARAYAYHKGAYPDEALAAADALLKAQPDDPYFLEMKGQILLESGRPAAAVDPLRRAVVKSGGAPMIASMLGHALVASDDPANLSEAERVLQASLNRDRENPFGWYVLGTVYARAGEPARAALASAEQADLTGKPGEAIRFAEQAKAGLKPGTSDYLRASDIVMVSRAAISQMKDKRRR